MLVDELVKQDVNYENSIALTQYSVLSSTIAKKEDEANVDELSSHKKIGRKPPVSGQVPQPDRVTMVKEKVSALQRSQP